MGQFLSNCSADSLAVAAQILIDGSLVAFPTETVYGLGADATNAMAVARIYSVKGRPTDHPLIVHISDMKFLDQWISEIPDYAVQLARNFWPGPMTLILKRSDLAKDFITGNQDTVGIRIPNNVMALGLLEAFHKLGGAGVAAPSANRFGQVSPTTASAVEEEIGAYLSESDLIVDGGPSEVGLESTIIDCTSKIPRILRPGAITEEMINNYTNVKIGNRFVYTDEDLAGITINGKPIERQAIRVSGSLENHYSPNATVLLDQNPLPGQGFIAMADVECSEGVIRLAEPKTHEEFARVLYAALRAADEHGLATVVVQQPLGAGIAIAIRDRLARSARGR